MKAMKRERSSILKNDDGTKRSMIKFRDYDDFDDGDDIREHSKKRLKDVGKRLHRKKTVKDDFDNFNNA